MKYFTKGKVIIKSWCNNPEGGAIDQAINLANHPFIFRQVCLMPDTHQGYGMPIGGVIGTKGCVIPNAVGVDIGCGMAAVKTSLTEIKTEDLKKIMGLIREKVPVGFKHHTVEQEHMLMPFDDFDNFNTVNMPVCCTEYRSALKQLGTLGGGNHFIEIQKGSDGHIWFMVHSGSRNLGFKVAKHYNNIAIELNKKWESIVTKDQELAFLPLDTDEATNYLTEMKYALDFAKANRNLMVERIKEAFNSVTDNGVSFEKEINIHHNYARMENHFGANVMIHRKGTTSAKCGELGIIPGSQGTSSYIIKGRGNPESFRSCSHGAGRKMGRKRAQSSLNLEEEQKRLEDKNIIHSIRNKGDLDEASGAYKDIDIVMEEQKDLIDIVVKLEPLGVIKG